MRPMPRLLVLFVTAFVDMVGLTMIIPLLPFYATELGASATVVGLLVSAFSVAQLAVAPLWGRFSDRYGRRPAILAGLLLTGGAYIIFASRAWSRAWAAAPSAWCRPTSPTPRRRRSAPRASAGSRP